MQVVEAFSSSYAQARSKFLQLSAELGLSVTSHVHPERGRDGEELAMDVVVDGPVDAPRKLLVTSGCHGVEGYCGSGVQIHSLADPTWREAHRAAGVTVVHVHAVNPYGFSHIRRVTHENVDLNRNFQDFSQPLPTNPAYLELHDMLLPRQWPPTLLNRASVAWYIATRGTRRLQTAISGGQYQRSDGLFYGGTAPTWSNRTFRQVLREHVLGTPQVAWIDLHTGLGECGACERLFAGPSGDDAALQRARDAWGGGGRTPIKTFDDGTSVSAKLTGLMWQAIGEECPQAEVTAIGMEFGTQPLLKVMEALRAEQWLNLHPQAPEHQARQIKQQLRDAFYVDTPEWKQQIVATGREAMTQALTIR